MIKCFPSAEEVAKQLNADFHEVILELASQQDAITIAVSGGSTPAMFFRNLADTKNLTGNAFPWEKIHMFWVDERCVAPTDEQSNYGMVQRLFLSSLNPCPIHVHRIKGEATPEREAERYSNEIMAIVNNENGVPVFDWIFLGTGEDGHMASIFPDRLDLLDSANVCEAVKHPATGQFRITLTGKAIFNTKRLTLMVTGKSKSEIIRQVFQQEPDSVKYPVAHIQSRFPDAVWYLDRDAAIHLNVRCRDQH